MLLFQVYSLSFRRHAGKNPAHTISLLIAWCSFFLAPHFTAAQIGPGISWQICLGGTASEYNPRLKKTPDNGYILLASTNSNNGDVLGNHGNYDGWVARLDSLGTLQWQKCYGGSAADYASEIILSAGGGYLLLIYANSNNGQVMGSHGGSEMWVVKIDSLGSLDWQHPLGGSSSEIPGGILELPDSSIMVCGYTLSNDGNVSGNHGGGDAWVVKLNHQGDIIWQKCFGGPEADLASGLSLLGNGDCLVTGYTYSNSGDVSGNHGGQDGWAFEIDTAGNLLWQHCYGGTQNEFFSSSAESGAHLFLAGTTKSNDGDVTGNHGLEDFWLLKTDHEGNLIQQKCFGGSSTDVLTSVSEKSGSGWVLCGESLSNDGDVIGNHNPGTTDGWLMRSDSSFGLLWSRCYGGSSVDFGFRVIADGNRLLAGGATTSTDGDLDCVQDGLLELWIFQTGKECEIPVSSAFSYEQSGLVFQFTDFSNQSDSWFWNFGDGTTSDEQNPVHEYAQSGIYEVCMAVSDSCGFDTSCAIINTCGWATAGFTYDQDDLSFSFHDASLEATAWQWDFGDGNSSAEQNPEHTFLASGIYLVTLIAGNACNTDSFTLTVNTCGTLSAGYTYSASQLLVTFSDTSSDNATAWYWSFGDGFNSMEQNPNHNYALPGEYNVSLLVTTACESKLVSNTITVCASAKASFSITSNGGDIVLDNNSAYATYFLWDFGNGATSTLAEPNYFFSDTGTFTICLSAENLCSTDDTCISFHNTYLGNAIPCWQQVYSESSAFDHTLNFIYSDAANRVISVGSSAKGSGSLLYENVFVLKYDEAGTLLWHRNLADSFPGDYFLPIASTHDSSGNIYVLFTWQQFPVFENTWGLTKLDESGEVLWTLEGDASLQERVTALAGDQQHHLIIAGYTLGSTLTGDFLVIKADADGNMLWKKSYDYNGFSDAASDVALSANGTIYVTGTAVADELDENERMITLIYDEEGNLLSEVVDGTDIAFGRKVITNPSGDGWALGGSSLFGEDPLVLIRRVGTTSWLSTYEGPADVEADVTPISISADSADQIYVAVQLDYKDQNDLKQSYPVLLKFDEGGTLVWEKYMTGTFASENLSPGYVLRNITASAAGKTFYTGYSKAAADPSSAFDIETGRINTDGTTEWLDRLDQFGLGDYGIAISLEAEGNILVGGRTDSGTDFSEIITLKYCIVCAPVPVTFAIPADTFCLGSSEVTLPGGMPPGGFYSGAGVIDGIFYPDSAGVGTHTIIYTVADNDQCVTADTQLVVVDVCTGIEASAGVSLTVEPNPFFTVTFIHLHLERKSAIKISVTDLSGKEIMQITDAGYLPGDYILPWDRKNRPAGIYLITVQDDFGITTLKVAVQ